MRNKLSVVLFTAVLVGVFLSASIVFAADAKHPRTTFKLDRAPKLMIPFERGPADMTPGPISLSTSAQKYAFAPPGHKAGQTTYDYQHNGSMGRMLATDLINNQMFFVWMAQTNYTIPGDRRIRGQAIDLATGGTLLDPAGDVVLGDYSGYTSCAAMPDGVYGGSSFAAHTSGGPDGSGDFHTRYCWDNSVFLGGGPWFIWGQEDMDENPYGISEPIWPIVTTHLKDEGDNLPAENMVYVLSHAGNDDPGEEMILFRRIGALSDTAVHFDQGTILEEATVLSYIIVADQNSNNVAVVYTDDRSGLSEGEGGGSDLDVYYMLSTDQGESWGDPINVSNYTEDSLWRAYTDLSALFTYDGYFHVIWNARELRDANTYENFKCRLVHWDNNTQKTTIIDEARYEMRRSTGTTTVACDCGAWNMYIAKMSLSECENKMYALFTKFGDDNEPNALNDCSDDNNASGELYLAASDDGGATWDTAWNLTKTRYPGCDSMNCFSEHWSSMALYGVVYGDTAVDDTLDISYIWDKDAGGTPQGEGSWCINDVMHYRFPCRDVAHIPRASYEPNQFLDPLHTLPSTPLDMTLKISNIGNEILDLEGISAGYENGSGWMSFSAPTQDPIPLSDFAYVTVTFNAGGILFDDPSGWDGYVIVDHNGPSDKDSLPVHLTVASDFNMPQNDTLRATTKKLMVYNTGRLGGDNDGAALDIPGDCDADLTTPNADLFLYDASPMMAWNDGDNNILYTTIFTQLFTEDGTFRPQSDLMMFDYSVDSGYNKMVCTLSTTDSTYGVGVQLWAPTDGNDFIIGQYDFTTWKPGLKGQEQVYIGMFLDWDIPADQAVRNASDYDETLYAIWQRGAELDSVDEDPPHSCPIEEDQRYGGVAVLNEQMVNAWTGVNADIQFGSGLNADSVFNRMSTYSDYVMYDTTGEEEDTVVDLHTGITFAEVDLTTKATYSWWFALATTNNGKQDLLDQLSAAKLWAEAKGIYSPKCECEPGNPNDDGTFNVGDAVYLITYIFKGGPAPTPFPLCSGDSNGDCTLNVGDAVYIITWIFKGGPKPVTCEEWRDGHPNKPEGCGEIR